MHRQTSRERDFGHCLKKFVRTPLRADRPQDGPDAAPCGAMPLASIALEHGEVLAPARDRQHGEFGPHSRIHQLLKPRQRLEELAVRHRGRDSGAQADISVGCS